MVFCFVAIDALEVIPPHVNINIFGREVEAFIQVAVLDGIAAAAVEVATAAIFARGSAYTLGCHGDQAPFS